MRNIILGTVAGLILGTAGALAYSHYVGDGQLLASLQAQLDAAKAALAKAEQDKKQLTQETSGISDQIDALQKSNDDLKKQLASGGTAPAPAAAAPPAINPLALAGMVMGMRGGFQTQQQLLLLKTRLHLTPEQEAKIKAAMETEAQARRAVMQQMFRNNGKVDPQTTAGAPQPDALQLTLATVLTPDQQAQYQQVQAEEQASRADTAATVQINQVAPLLQLSDSQKDQVFNALYQVQMGAPDPTTMMTNPMAAVTAQSQATQAALAKVLTPDQMALYQQAAAAVPTFGGGGGRRAGGNGGGGNGGGGNGGGGGGNGATPTATGGGTVGSNANANSPAP